MRYSEDEKTNLTDMSIEEKKVLSRNTFTGKSYFQTLFNCDQLEINCSNFNVLFRNEIERILLEKNLIKETIPLENLYQVLSDEMRAYDFEFGVNKISTYFYDTDAKFMQIYHQFIKFLRENFIHEPFYFQATPTIRIHCPNAENSHHYPRYHSDICLGHPPEEINIWLPLTEILDGHGFKMMSVASSQKILDEFDYDLAAFTQRSVNDKDFTRYCDTHAKPVTTGFGKLIAFDSRSIHTGVPMVSHTRASLDIRVVPLSQYEKMKLAYQGSGRRKIMFTPGNCYSEKDSDHLPKN